MSTQYIISATAFAAERTMANKKSAVTEADNRARFARSGGDTETETVTVTTAATGKVVHSVVVTPPRPAAKAESKRVAKDGSRRGQRRPALADSAVEGFEVLYVKPRAHYEVLRAVGGEDTAPGEATEWLLRCTKHETLEDIPTLASQRGLAKEDWCKGCRHEHIAAVAEAALAA